MRTPEDLADADSRFREACGITAHYKCFSPKAYAQEAKCAIACYHGFGANLWSWERVQQQLADAVGGVVSAHDMPGFGLTERSRRQEAYRLRTNGDIGRALLAHELQQRAGAGARPFLALVATCHQPGCCCTFCTRCAQKRENEVPDASHAECKVCALQLPTRGHRADAPARAETSEALRVLVGHSLGCAAIAASFIADPMGVDGIVLVAPAIMANPFKHRAQLVHREVRCAS